VVRRAQRPVRLQVQPPVVLPPARPVRPDEVPQVRLRHPR
jgi:hypothetical protein